MFPFHRKHGNNSGLLKSPGKTRVQNRNEDDMSDEEYLEYIHHNDYSRLQSTSNAHDRYCNNILKEKEEILLSSLNPGNMSTPKITNSIRLGPNNYDLFDRCPIITDNRTAKSLPPSPQSDSNPLPIGEDLYIRRKSDLSIPSCKNLEANFFTVKLKVNDVEPSCTDQSDDIFLYNSGERSNFAPIRTTPK